MQISLARLIEMKYIIYIGERTKTINIYPLTILKENEK